LLTRLPEDQGTSKTLCLKGPSGSMASLGRNAAEDGQLTKSILWSVPTRTFPKTLRRRSLALACETTASRPPSARAASRSGAHAVSSKETRSSEPRSKSLRSQNHGSSRPQNAFQKLKALESGPSFILKWLPRRSIPCIRCMSSIRNEANRNIIPASASTYYLC